MKTSVLLKNSVKMLAFAASTVAIASSAQAGIVLQYGSLGYPSSYVTSGQGMSSIVMPPPPAYISGSSYILQRSLAWQTYRREHSDTGFPLVYVPSVTGSESANSPRQANVRAHVARASAYRLKYFNK